jgi:hypothetical protein
MNMSLPISKVVTVAELTDDLCRCLTQHERIQIMRSLVVRILTALALALVLGSLAQAQATRTWVSGVGDDANPCSRTAPCKTFAGAISKTAAGGEISALDPGGFGAVTITKSITLNRDGNLTSIVINGTNGININAGASDVIILRSLSLNGTGG